MKASSKGIEVICAIDTRVPIRVRGDGDRLRQVVLNLLSNAMKFTQGGEVEVRTELVSETATHHVMKVSVRDTGIGIPEAAQSKLFDRFSQVDSSTTRNYGGTGLGLAISKQLVELMSGTMGVTSMPGEGSTFWFTAMLEKVETLPEEVRRLPSELCPMLVVSQNCSTRNVLTGCLEAWGAQVSGAADGGEAQIYLNSKSTVTAILSLSIPEYNLVVMDPIVAFIIASVTKVRFWIILCPISFVRQIRDLIAEMAASFAAKGEMFAADAVRAIVILSQTVRQGVLYDCLMQLSRNGAYRRRSFREPESHQEQELRVGCRSGRHLHETMTVMDDVSKPDDEERHNLANMLKGVSISSTVETEVPSFRVLVAEDSLACQMTTKRMLIKQGAAVTVVADGSAAVDLVLTQGLRFNLALFDLQMPIMGGVEAQRLIRKATDMPVIAISASLDDAQRQCLIDEGFSTAITKPFSEGVCQEILREHGYAPLRDLNVNQPATITRISHSIENTYGDRCAMNKEYPYLLLVVSDPASQKMIQRITEQDGLAVDFALNGIEAVAKALKTPYDVILMDCDLPIKDGWQATREIREWELACGGHSGKRMSIIAATAHKAMCGDCARCIDAGMDDCLTKPVQRTSLLQMAGTYTTHNSRAHIVISIYFVFS